MKIFQKWLVEDQHEIPNLEKNMVDAKRIECPQIKDHHAMVDDLSKNGIFIYKQSCNPREYLPAQKEFDHDKIDRMISKYNDGYDMKPIVVSRDNVVIDGNHRWIALHNSDVDPSKYLTTRVNLNYDQFCKFIEGKPYVKYESI